MKRPHAGEAISLQLYENGLEVRIDCRRQTVGSGEGTDKVLDVMANFMRDHIGLGEVTRC